MVKIGKIFTIYFGTEYGATILLIITRIAIKTL